MVEKASTWQKGPSGPPIEQFGDRRVWRKDVVEKASTQQRAGPPGPAVEQPWRTGKKR